MKTMTDMTGTTWGTLTVTGYSHTEHAMAYWDVTCTCGNTKAVRGTYLRQGVTTTCGDQREHPRRPRRATGKNMGYHQAHGALRALLGPASAFGCPCGDQATEWAFLGCDDAVNHGATGAYCPNACPSEYAPRCRTCHRALDRARREQPVMSLIESLEYVA